MVRVTCGVVLLAVLASGCGPTVDLSQALEVRDVATGWRDAGLVDGKNKLVPSLALRLHNASEHELIVLQLNILFRRVSEPEAEWGSAFLRVTGSEGLAPGGTTDLQVAISDLGYTGTEPRLQMLENSYFVDAKADVFAKYSSTNWTRIGEYPVERRLIE